MDREQALAAIAEEIRRCRACRRGKSGLAVPGTGSPRAKIVLIGEAPGKKEALSGQPFIGPAGKFLDAMLSAAGLRRSQVFITSPVKYLPKQVTPTQAQIEHGAKHLLMQLAVIRPKILVLMGASACQAVLNRRCSVSVEHGRMIKLNRLACFISYHPAAALHAPRLRPVLLADFKKLKRLAKTL